MNKLIYIINGPNLNKLGSREPSKYGKKNIDDLKNLCVDTCEKNDLELNFYDSLYFYQLNLAFFLHLLVINSYACKQVEIEKIAQDNLLVTCLSL